MWKTVQLGDAIEIARGGSPRPIKSFITTEKDGVNWIKIGDTKQGGRYIYTTKEKIKPSGISRSRYVKENDFLLSNSMSFGRPYILKTNGCIHDGWLVLSEYQELFSADYLYYLLSSSLVQNQFERLARGSTVRNLNIELVSQVTVPVPPLIEQQRIVAKLDSAFAEIDAAVKTVEKNVGNISALFDSSLELCLKGDEATVSDIFLSDTNFVNIIDGDRGTNYPNKSEFLDDGFCLFLNTKNVLKDGFNFNNKMFITAAKDTLLRKGKLIREDVVLTTRGTIGNIGHYSQDVEFENIRINSGMVILRANKVYISPKYLFEILRSRSFKIQVEKLQKGAAQQHIPIKTLYEINFPVPNSLEEQNKIVQKIRAHQKKINALSSLNQQKACELKALKSAVLAQELQSEAA